MRKNRPYLLLLILIFTLPIVAHTDQTEVPILALVRKTNKDIQKDIEETQGQVLKLKDNVAQGDAVRELLLRTVGRMASCASVGYNLYMKKDTPYYGDFIGIPYFLIGRDNYPEYSPDGSWVDEMKDLDETPEFKNPVHLMTIIGKNFEQLAKKVDADTKKFFENPGILPHQQSDPDEDSSNFPPLIKTKLRFQNLHPLPQSQL
jgi:hypothetical protein